MKKTFLFLCICIVLSKLSFAGSISKQDLINDFKKAHEAASVEAFKDLYLWENISPDMAALTEQTITTGFLALPLTSVEIEPLDENRKTQFVVNGYKYYPNVELVGYLKLNHNKDDQTGFTSIPFGIHEGQYYLANTVKQKMEGATAQQQYSINIFSMPDSAEGIKFSGQINFISNGEHKIEKISGRNNISKSFWADEITRCVIKRLSGTGEMDVTIYESGQKIFVKNGVYSNKDIIYKKDH